MSKILIIDDDNFICEVQEDTFRESLYHRLNECKITVPPLRERPEDIHVFVNHFVSMANAELNRQVEGITSEAEILQLYDLKLPFKHHL